MSLVLDGTLVELPGFETKCFANDPTVPRTTDGSRRVAADTKGIVIHTVTGQPFQPKLLPGSRPSEHAERLARYQAYSERKVSWHFTVDTDGTIVQSADPGRWVCWHAGGVNPWTIGIELCQGPGGELYEVQLAAMQALVKLLCATFKIRERLPVRAGTGRLDGGVIPPVRAGTGQPYGGVIPPERAGTGLSPHGGVIPRLQGSAAPWSGVFGHRNQTEEKGHGDPGDAPFEALLRVGFEAVPFP